MKSGVQQWSRQSLRSFAFFPAARSMRIIDEKSAKLLHHGEKRKPIMKFVIPDLIPEVARARRANLEPKRCGPNLLLRTDVNCDLHDVGHEIAQLG